MKINIFWFRRDLRLEDNTAFKRALGSGLPVLPLFIFDPGITDELTVGDPRVAFIHESLAYLNKKFTAYGSSLYILKGETEKIWEQLIASFDIKSVYINKDYEPYTIRRDELTELLLKKKGIVLIKTKDQVIHEEKEIVKADNSPYTIFTPYRKKWLQALSSDMINSSGNVLPDLKNLLKCNFPFPELEKLGFAESSVKVTPYNLDNIRDYDKVRDIPSLDGTTCLGPYLRFGTISIRKLVKLAIAENEVFLNQLIWREFFMQILFNYPYVITGSFKSKYDGIHWRNDEKDFEKWCKGETGYPLVDAGMRQLNSTGYMHNRIRMVTASFLCKHLLIDWRWGEAFFAEKLNDFELSANNGNWQWVAGTGCDAAPFFRIFNPHSQQQRFDPAKEYIRRWVENIDKKSYPEPMIPHEFARKRALSEYWKAISF